MDLSCGGYLSGGALAGVKEKKKKEKGKIDGQEEDWILDEMLFEWASVRVGIV